MQHVAKIHLSEEEEVLLKNSEWILTKHVIMQKVYDLFGDVNTIIKDDPFFISLSKKLSSSNGKISKGENYKGLPYVILDHPNAFSKNNIFAIRTMFWWGNFFSVSLHLSGEYKANYLHSCSDIFSYLKENNFFICINEKEWEHHFEDENYVAAKEFTQSAFENILSKPFFKAAKNLSLEDWNNAGEFILKTYAEIKELLSVNFQDDKKDLSPVFPKAGSGL